MSHAKNIPLAGHPRRIDIATAEQPRRTVTDYTMPGTRGPVPVPLVEGGRDLTQQVLDVLENTDPLHTNVEFPDVSQREIKAALDRLASRSMLTYDTQEAEQVLLTAEGQTICDEGSHEYKVWDVVQQKGKVPLKELPVWSWVVGLYSRTRLLTKTISN